VRLLRAFIALGLVATGWPPLRPAPAKGKDPAQENHEPAHLPLSCGEVVSGCICETGMSMKATVEKRDQGGEEQEGDRRRAGLAVRRGHPRCAEAGRLQPHRLDRSLRAHAPGLYDRLAVSTPPGEAPGERVTPRLTAT